MSALSLSNLAIADLHSAKVGFIFGLETEVDVGASGTFSVEYDDDVVMITMIIDSDFAIHALLTLQM